ncbi:MAG: AraC family transcriptional regulator [Faecalicatena sp.]|uniref:helix-turn-helix domain-containing protein n=1 Tax=Faecalicatena sp. TaxID=2005360 RepID=UPI002589A6FD|nr:AraC family transcriptional regulator [Faecalicatena sp.]MCI6467569.1 AraC family transcriptional regulator [Faecalicatena sp.]MDY5619746.1 AraC family transcriptional regulator [Lachnospiraceae bacterium]
MKDFKNMPISMKLNTDYSEKVQYDYTDYPIYIRRDLLSHYPNFTAPNHWHADIEMIAVISGEMKYNVNGKKLLLKSGEGIFVNAEQMHYGYSDTGTECDFICILLHPMLLCSSLSYEQDFILPLIRNSRMPFVLLHSETSWQREIYDQIRFLYEKKETRTAPLRILSSFSHIWMLLYENMSADDARDTRQDRDLTITKDMVGFIQKNYTWKLSLADIAASGSVGQSKCCRLFSRYFSQTPMMYLNQYRLNKSIELLRGTDLTITEIALSIGFGGASYFAETFRKWAGMSPTKFRKKLL